MSRKTERVPIVDWTEGGVIILMVTLLLALVAGAAKADEVVERCGNPQFPICQVQPLQEEDTYLLSGVNGKTRVDVFTWILPTPLGPVRFENDVSKDPPAENSPYNPDTVRVIDAPAGYVVIPEALTVTEGGRYEFTLRPYVGF